MEEEESDDYDSDEGLLPLPEPPSDPFSEISLVGLGRDITGIICKHLRLCDLFNLQLTCKTMFTRLMHLHAASCCERRFLSRFKGKVKINHVFTGDLVLEMINVPLPNDLFKKNKQGNVTILHGKKTEPSILAMLKKVYLLKGFDVTKQDCTMLYQNDLAKQDTKGGLLQSLGELNLGPSQLVNGEIRFYGEYISQRRGVGSDVKLLPTWMACHYEYIATLSKDPNTIIVDITSPKCHVVQYINKKLGRERFPNYFNTYAFAKSKKGIDCKKVHKALIYPWKSEVKSFIPVPSSETPHHMMHSFLVENNNYGKDLVHEKYRQMKNIRLEVFHCVKARRQLVMWLKQISDERRHGKALLNVLREVTNEYPRVIVQHVNTIRTFSYALPAPLGELMMEIAEMAEKFAKNVF